MKFTAPVLTRHHLPLAALALMTLLTPAQAAAPARDPAADRCTVKLLGVDGELVSGVGLVDAGGGLSLNRAKLIETAKADARRDAREQLRAKVCGGLADPRDCDAEMAHLLQKEEVYEERYACAVMAVEAKLLGTSTAEGRANHALVSLGQAVRAGLNAAGAQGAVSLDIVRTPEGCSAVGLEAARSQVASALTGELVASEASSAGVWQVKLEASQVGPQLLQIAARLVDPADPSGARSRPVAQSAQFPASAFGEVKLTGACAAPMKARSGAGGLTVQISMPTKLCAGERFQPVLEVSQPARVQVWSVAGDGSALLLVPGDDGHGGRESGKWTGRRPLMESQAFPGNVPGDEMLVAVALPESVPVSAGALPPNCKVARFDASRIPAGAAVAVQSWRVLDDPGHCPKAPEMHALATQLDAVMARLPMCW